MPQRNAAPIAALIEASNQPVTAVKAAETRLISRLWPSVLQSAALFGEESFVPEVFNSPCVKKYLSGNHTDAVFLDVWFACVRPDIMKDDAHLTSVFGRNLPHDRLHHSTGCAANGTKFNEGHVLSTLAGASSCALTLCVLVHPGRRSASMRAVIQRHSDIFTIHSLRHPEPGHARASRGT